MMPRRERQRETKGEEIVFDLYNPIGEKVYSKAVTQENGVMEIKFALEESLAPGVYLFTGTTQKETLQQKIIIR